MSAAPIDLTSALGFRIEDTEHPAHHGNGHSTSNGAADGQRQTLLKRINLRLVADGLLPAADSTAELQDIAGGLLQSFREMARTLREHRCPADARIEAFLKEHFKDLE